MPARATELAIRMVPTNLSSSHTGHVANRMADCPRHGVIAHAGEAGGAGLGLGVHDLEGRGEGPSRLGLDRDHATELIFRPDSDLEILRTRC
jgi:hypothetical protein